VLASGNSNRPRVGNREIDSKKGDSQGTGKRFQYKCEKWELGWDREHQQAPKTWDKARGIAADKAEGQGAQSTAANVKGGFCGDYVMLRSKVIRKTRFWGSSQK